MGAAATHSDTVCSSMHLKFGLQSAHKHKKEEDEDEEEEEGQEEEETSA